LRGKELSPIGDNSDPDALDPIGTLPRLIPAHSASTRIWPTTLFTR